MKYVDHVAHSTLVTLSRMGVGLGEYKALGLGFLLALSDVFNFSIVKMLRTGQLKNMALMAIPTTVYALQPWIVYFSLGFSTLTVMNLLWDVMSDILVTAVGLFYFKETISFKKHIGVMFALMAVFLLGGPDGDGRAGT